MNAWVVTRLSRVLLISEYARAGAQSNEINRFYTGVARGLDLEMLLAAGAFGRGRRKSERGVHD